MRTLLLFLSCALSCEAALPPLSILPLGTNGLPAVLYSAEDGNREAYVVLAPTRDHYNLLLVQTNTITTIGLDVGGFSFTGAPVGMELIDTNLFLCVTGLPFKLMRMGLSGGTPPTTATCWETNNFPSVDWRGGPIVKMDSGGLFEFAYKFTPGPNPYPMTVGFSYRHPDTGVWEDNMTNVFVGGGGGFTSCRYTAARHPADNSAWAFWKRDSYSQCEAARVYETNGSFAVEMLGAYISQITNGTDSVDGELPFLFSLQDTNTQTIKLIYERDDSIIFTNTPFTKGSYTAVVDISADKSKTFLHFDQYQERDGSFSGMLDGTNLCLLYHPIDISGVYPDLLFVRYENGAWTYPTIFSSGFTNFMSSGRSRPGMWYAKTTPDQSLVLVRPSFWVNRFWIVATDGTDGGAGSLASPLSISKALGSTSPVHAGDTIYIRGGTYAGGQVATIAGTASLPIAILPYGTERPILEATATNTTVLALDGSYLTLSGLELWNSAATRAPRNSGIIMRSPGSKVRNCIIHDTGVGIYVGEESIGSEIYGNLIYNYGDAVLPAKHAIYAHSTQQNVTIKDNVTFNGFYCGLQCYSEVSGQLDGFQIIGNACAESGSLFGTTDRQPNYLIGGTVPADHVALVQNSGYLASSFQDNLLMGYQTTDNGTGNVSSNYFGRGRTTFNLWTNLTVRANGWQDLSSFYSYNLIGSPGTYSWDNNAYSAPFSCFQIGGGGGLSFAAWKGSTGFDGASTFAAAPVGMQAYVRANDYITGRSTVTVFNWGLADNVSVDLTGACAIGTYYAARNAADYFAGVVTSFTYAGIPVSFPMTNLSVATPVGVDAAAATGPEFNIFLVEIATNNPVSPPIATFRLRAAAP